MNGFQLKINVKDSSKPMWRRVIVPEKLTFNSLHLVIQKYLLLKIVIYMILKLERKEFGFLVMILNMNRYLIIMKQSLVLSI